MNRTLILGYGNADRQDDGVAWHVLAILAKHLGRGDYPRSEENSPEESFQQLEGTSPELLFQLQLTPETAELLAEFDRVCFVDAHTGNVPEEVHLTPVVDHYESSPFTHHMTPSTCLALAHAVYGQVPEAILVSVRGYEFGFTRSLSLRTSDLAGQAAEIILAWLQVPP